MNMNWRWKSFAFSLIDFLSLRQLLFFLQRHLTKRSRIEISEIAQDWLTHRANLDTLKEPIVLEFGAGKSLAQNIFLSQYFGPQTVVDLFAMLDLDLVNETILQLTRLCPSLKGWRTSGNADLERHYGIRYIAPLDVRKAPFRDNTFDACISTATLEHIPHDDIAMIFGELRRIIRPDGLVSAIIDYSDHYSHTDRNIGRLNFLQYSASDFARYNHECHYQNRLRHCDYIKLFTEAGYEIRVSEATDFTPRPPRISNEFDEFDPSLCAGKGIFLLQVKK